MGLSSLSYECSDSAAEERTPYKQQMADFSCVKDNTFYEGKNQKVILITQCPLLHKIWALQSIFIHGKKKTDTSLTI